MSNTQAISLGWRCEAAETGVNLGIRNVKANGYLTCPFDLCVTNYRGIMECIKDDFKHFCDPNYLILKKAPPMKKHLGDNQKDDEFFIYNTYYNFSFNHEAPGHADLYIGEKWPGGINHFVDNNFEKFIERYQKRIENFRNYIKTSDAITFIIMRYNAVPVELERTIAEVYPHLVFKIYCWTNFSWGTIMMTRTKNIEGARDFEVEYLRFMNFDPVKDADEYKRYYSFEPLVNNSNRIELKTF